MRLKPGIPAIALTAALVSGAIFYIDSRIPRATATVRVYPPIVMVTGRKGPIEGLITKGDMEAEEESILSHETLVRALKLLDGEKESFTAQDIERLHDKMSTEVLHEAGLIQITAKADTKKKAIELSNKVAEAFINRRQEEENLLIQRARQMQDDELSAQEELIRENAAALGRFSHHNEDSPQRKTRSRSGDYLKAKKNYEQSKECLRQMKVAHQKYQEFFKKHRPAPVTLRDAAR